MRPDAAFWTAGTILLLVTGPPAVAHPHDYVQAGIGDAAAVCVDANLGLYAVGGVGGACIAYDNGHVRRDAYGRATLSISDLLGHPVSGTYCQDTNADLLCGVGGEPGLAFCGSIIIQQGTTWDPSLAIIVRVHGPVFGVATLSPCNDDALDSPTFGSVGSVYHS